MLLLYRDASGEDRYRAEIPIKRIQPNPAWTGQEAQISLVTYTRIAPTSLSFDVINNSIVFDGTRDSGGDPHPPINGDNATLTVTVWLSDEFQFAPVQGVWSDPFWAPRLIPNANLCFLRQNLFASLSSQEVDESSEYREVTSGKCPYMPLPRCPN